MKILIIGATRGIGSQVLQQALTKDHDITVLARSPQKLAVEHERLQKKRRVASSFLTYSEE